MCIVVIRLFGGLVKRQAAKRGSTVHEPSSFFLFVPPTSTMASCESAVRPLSIVPQGISRKRMVSGTTAVAGEH
jgi:hypothetical protein